MGQANGKLATRQLEDLSNKTDFSREQLKDFFVKFQKDFPTGYMTKDQFTKVYKDYYKTGESERFSEHVFRAFDDNGDGKIDFREFICSLSMTTTGTVDDKLRWAFNMYDVDGDGTVTIAEVCNIARSVQQLMGVRDANLSDEKMYRMFAKCDKNGDGTLTVEEFIKGSKSNPVFMKLLMDYVK